VPSSHLQEMRQDHLGRLRPARQAGDGRRPGLPALRRPRQRPCRQRRLAAQALRPRLNRHRITPTIRTDPWCPRRARATSRIAPLLAGGAAAENYDLEQVLASRTPIVFGMLAALGFILLLVALGAPLIAFPGVVVTGLSVAGAFGVTRLIFQDGHLAGLLNFTPQGFVDAWC